MEIPLPASETIRCLTSRLLLRGEFNISRLSLRFLHKRISMQLLRLLQVFENIWLLSSLWLWSDSVSSIWFSFPRNTDFEERNAQHFQSNRPSADWLEFLPHLSSSVVCIHRHIRSLKLEDFAPKMQVLPLCCLSPLGTSLDLSSYKYLNGQAVTHLQNANISASYENVYIPDPQMNTDNLQDTFTAY